LSRRAARYQQLVTGHPVEEAYWVGGVGRKNGGVAFVDGSRDPLKFDGWVEDLLREAPSSSCVRSPERALAAS